MPVADVELFEQDRSDAAPAETERRGRTHDAGSNHGHVETLHRGRMLRDPYPSFGGVRAPGGPPGLQNR